MIRSDLYTRSNNTNSGGEAPPSIQMVDDDVLFSTSPSSPILLPQQQHQQHQQHQQQIQHPSIILMDNYHPYPNDNAIEIEYMDNADPFAVHQDSEQEPFDDDDDEAFSNHYSSTTTTLNHQRGSNYELENDNNTTSEDNNNTTTTKQPYAATLTPSYSIDSVSSLNSVNSKSALTGGISDLKLSLLKTVGGARKLREMYTQDLEKKQVEKKKHYIYTYLTLLGLLGGFISFSHDIIVRYLVLGKNSLINLFDPEEYFYLRLFIWVAYNLCFIMFALVLTALFAPSAEGSGLAGIKAILNGVRGLKDVLSMKTMIVKYLSLPAVLTAGLYIGKMGPSIHIVTCVAKNLMKFKLFESIRKTKTLKQEMIVCGIAVGCAANDGAVVGGVLFGAELVGTYYSLRNYFKSFYAAFIACMTSRLLHSAVNLNIKPFLTWNIKIIPPSFTLPELFVMLFVAVVMSFVGIAVVFVNERLLVLRDKYGKLHLGPFKFAKYAANKLVILTENRIIFTIIITLVTSFLSFPQTIGKFMSIGGVPIFEELLMTKPLTAVNGAKGEWIHGNISEVFITISIFITIRYILTILTTILPVSGGSYLQLLIIGASFGRLVGEGLAFILPDGFSPNHPIIPASYGLVAAAALTSSQTQAFSSVFILLELTGHGVHLPALGASYIGVVISRWLSYSAYDFVIKFRKWPAVLESTTDSDNIRVKYIMQYVDSLPILEEKASLRKIGEFLEKPNLAKTIPIVNSMSDLLLVGCVNTKKLQDFYTTMKPTLETNPEYDTEIEIEKNTCPITISEDTPLVLAHLLFSKLNLDDVFVVWRGRLIGQVQKSSIIAELTDRNAGVGDV